MRRIGTAAVATVALLAGTACGGGDTSITDLFGDAGEPDAGPGDAAPDAPSDASVRVDAGPVDAGSGSDAGPDAGPACPGACTAEIVLWGPSGGLTPERRSYELSPCGRVLQRIDRFDSMGETCVLHVDEEACETLAEINRLIATPAVEALRAEAPVVVGIDDRPVDGVILEVTIGGDVIGVGHDCEGASGCVPVPPELRELETALAVLEERFVRPDVCPGEHAETFTCGEDVTIECLTGREVCYHGYPGTPERPIRPPSCEVPGPDRSDCTGELSCECLVYNAFVEVCREPAPGEITIEHTGP